jgi:outer membrane protein OmpA-like peptidoglycan-associated protein
MQIQATPLAHIPAHRSSLRRALLPAVVLCLLPLGNAFAQSMPYVRVTRDKSEINSLRQVDDAKMRAPKGVVLEVIYIEGDRYAHQDSNWYWVLLPKDPWATRPAGWIRGDAVELAPAPVLADTTAAPSTSLAAARPAETGVAHAGGIVAASDTVPAREPVREIAPARAIVSDVVLNFQFGRSDLTDEAKSKLASAVTMPPAQARTTSVALEGYADWIGSEGYNERLGLARAEAVRRYLAEQLKIPADQISVVSYGESNPSAPNTTREGRALNRRVVIKVGA